MTVFSLMWHSMGGHRPLLEATLPAGLRIYAIGDIHGYSNLLDRLCRRIEADLAQSRPEQALAVFLGDSIDRGPDSAGVLDRLAAGAVPFPIVTLRGNHEDLMLKALADSGALADWCQSGGIETMESYGVDVGNGSRKALAKGREALLERLPAAHRSFLESTRLSYTAGDYFFVHAGVRPGIALELQNEFDMLWIRGEFSTSGYDFGKVIVHGHTPHARPESEPNRINVDTGAFKTGVLTCVALEGSTRRFLSTRE